MENAGNRIGNGEETLFQDMSLYRMSTLDLQGSRAWEGMAR